MAKVIGFDTASTITADILDKAIAGGADYVELYEKYSTPGLVTLIHSKGLGVAPIYETTAERALAGEDAGKTDAQAFLASVSARFGVPGLPSSVAPAYAVDFDVTEEQQPAVLAYGTGWSAGMAGTLRSRIYGNGSICEAAKEAGIVDFTWVAGAPAERGTATYIQSGGEDERQEVGDKENLDLPIEADSDVAVTPDLSWIWWPAGDPRQDAPVAAEEAAAATAVAAGKGAQSPPFAPLTPIPPLAIAEVGVAKFGYFSDHLTSIAAGAQSPLLGVAPPATPAALPDLKTAQAELQAKGLYKGEIDGIWGPESAAAFAAWYAPPGSSDAKGQEDTSNGAAS